MREHPRFSAAKRGFVGKKRKTVLLVIHGKGMNFLTRLTPGIAITGAASESTGHNSNLEKRSFYTLCSLEKRPICVWTRDCVSL